MIELDAPVSRYLPDLPVEDRFGPPSTIAQLLALKGGYADVVLESHAPTSDTWQPLGDYLMANLPPRAIQPGMVYSYNSWEHAMLGYTLESVTGSPYDRVIAENQQILDPIRQFIFDNFGQNGLYAAYLLADDNDKAMLDFNKAAELGDEDAINYLKNIGHSPNN